MEALISRVAFHLQDLYAESDLALRKSCWLCYGMIPFSASLLVIDLLSTLAGALLWLTMGYSGWRHQQSSGTIYESHFRNLFISSVLPFLLLALYGILLGSVTGLVRLALLGVLAVTALAVLGMIVHGVLRLMQYRAVGQPHELA